MVADGTGALSVLGLSAAQQDAYVRLIARHTATAAQLEPGWPHPEPLDRVLDGLVGVRLAYRSDGGYTAVAPRDALDARLTDGWDRLRAAREYADRIARDYQPPHPGTGAQVVELVTGTGAVAERLLRALRDTRTELRRLARPPYPDPAVDAAIQDLAVPTRILHERGDRAAPAPHARTLDHLPVALYLIDDRLAVVPTSADTALVVHPSELLRALGLLFDGLWERAAPAGRPGEVRGPDEGRLVDLLLSGQTDEAISRALGVSPRTAQRYIAAMMAAAGARTRFQAGVQVALRRASGRPRET